MKHGVTRLLCHCDPSKMSRIINTEELIRNAPFELSKADKVVLTTTEEDFFPHTWEDIQEIIGQKTLSSVV